MYKCIQPYSDDYMVWDETTQHYVLTEKALMERVGLNLRARIGDRSLITPEIAIKSFNTTVSDMIYQFIHEHNINNAAQDRLIATVPEIRRIIQRAMELQALYVSVQGNLYLSTKPEERAAAIDYMAQSVLGTVVSCLGISILYTGVLQ